MDQHLRGGNCRRPAAPSASVDTPGSTLMAASVTNDGGINHVTPPEDESEGDKIRATLGGKWAVLLSQLDCKGVHMCV